MPAEPPYRLEQRTCHVEDALPLLNGGARLFRGFVIFIKRHPLKKAGGRQLLGVTHDDDLSATRKRADGVLRPELGRLIHHDKIEFKLAGCEILRHGERAHHEAGFEG
jgi:hypothetical protein